MKLYLYLHELFVIYSYNRRYNSGYNPIHVLSIFQLSISTVFIRHLSTESHLAYLAHLFGVRIVLYPVGVPSIVIKYYFVGKYKNSTGCWSSHTMFVSVKKWFLNQNVLNKIFRDRIIKMWGLSYKYFFLLSKL